MSSYALVTQAGAPESGELVSSPFEIKCWPLIGGMVRVPPGHCAALTGPGGIVRVLGEGLQGLYGLPWGPYMVQLVNMRRFHLRPPSVSAITKDGWQAQIQATLECRVRSPHAVVQLNNPMSTLRDAAVSAITCVMKTTVHDLLIGSASDTDESYEAISGRIRKQLQATLRGSGLEVVNVLVVQPQGDERRLEIRRQSQIDETQISARQMVLTKQIELEREQQELALLQAETKRKEAEEEQKIRLEQARLELAVTQLLQGVREWETKLQLVPDLTRQRHEQVLGAINAHAQILGKMAELGNLEVLGVSSRRRPAEIGIDRLEAVLGQGLTNLKGLLDEAPNVLDPRNLDTQTKSAASLLTGEVEELSTIEGLAWTLQGQGRDGDVRLEVHFNDMIIRVICGPGFPSTQPEVLVFINGVEQMYAPPIQWEPGSLKRMILNLVERFFGLDSIHESEFQASLALEEIFHAEPSAVHTHDPLH